MSRSFAQKVQTRGRSYWRRATNRLELQRKASWPTQTGPKTDKVAAVTVNYNTLSLVRHLIYSLHKTGAASRISSLVVVDNASTDGSWEFLKALADRDVIVLLRNTWPPYHGPALNRAFSYLAASDLASHLERVWILDSDTVVLHNDTLDIALEAARASDAAILGQFAPESARQSSDHVMLCSTLVDPSRVWARGMPVFQEHGLPFDAIQAAVLERGWHIEGFPFCSGEYVLHLGGATITNVARDGKRANAYYSSSGAALEYADDSISSYGFQGVENGPTLYREFLDDYEDIAGSLDPPGFADLMVDLRAGSA